VLAKDLCIQLNNSSIAGSALVLKKLKLGERNTGPVGGYLARYSSVSPDIYYLFSPIYGQSVTDTGVVLAMGMTVPYNGVFPGSGSAGGSGAVQLNLNCSTGGDGSFDTLDQCGGNLGNEALNGHVVPCDPIFLVK
jgi:hypothetical protein